MFTQIHSALDDYKTGAYKGASKEFSEEDYGPIYVSHLANLERMQAVAPVACANLQTEVWKLAS